MRDYTLRLYSFDELDEMGKEKAIEEMQNRLHEWIGEEELTDFLTYKLEEEISDRQELEINYSLSYCQGDGVALYGRIYREQGPTLTWPDRVAYVDLLRTSISNRYSHWNSFNVEASDEADEPVDLAGTVIEQQLRDLCKDLERAGYKYMEGATSKEAAISYIQDNYADDFLPNGRVASRVGIVYEEANA
jgi:hypothetical protein